MTVRNLLATFNRLIGNPLGAVALTLAGSGIAFFALETVLPDVGFTGVLFPLFPAVFFIGLAYFLYTRNLLGWFVKVLGIAFLLVASLFFALVGSSMKDHFQRERNREDIAEGVRRGLERSRRGY